MVIKKLFIVVVVAVIAIILLLNFNNKQSDLPLVAIANYGPHASLDASIQGIKDELADQGYIENKTIRYEIADVGFDSALIPQMISNLQHKNPKVMVVMTTPVAQFAKGVIKNIPLVYNVITDPIEAALIKQSQQANRNMTGSSDKQDVKILLQFAQRIIPNAKRIGLLYSTAEINDVVLVKMMKQAAETLHMEVIAVAIDQARDIPIRLQSLKNKVDFIYVGASGPIQPTLPAIAAEANKMRIPVLNVDEAAVKEGLVLASFGVSYKKIGTNAGKLITQILKGIDVTHIPPIFPSISDHHGFISKSKAAKLQLEIPENLTNLTIVE